jgi:serine/threonine protein kinase
MSKLTPGTIVDRYVVEGLLGKGGMAVVYRVRHKDLDSAHALKVLTIHSDGIRERLHQEGKAQARIRHTNIVSVTDLVDVWGAPGLIMECVDGPDLSQVMPLIEGKLELADALARGIISGLQEAHRLGMVHRDLKPGNILVAQQGDQPVPKITDFGLVKVLIEESGGRGEHRTQAGSTMGTPAYMAPEQIRDPRLVDARADIFSLGVILYELACGRKPFEAPDMLALFTAITSGDFVHPRQVNPSIPERMERAIIGALEVEREQRIPDCRVLFEVWEGRLVDWKADALERVDTDKARWSAMLSTARPPEAELSNSMTAIPSSLEPQVAQAAPQADDGVTFYGDEFDVAEAVPPAPAAPEQHPQDTYYHPPLEGDEGIPSQAVVPAAPPTAVPEDPTPAPRRKPAWLLPVLGAAGLGALLVGVTMLMPDEPSPAAPQPVEAPSPADPAAATPSPLPDAPAPEPPMKAPETDADHAEASTAAAAKPAPGPSAAPPAAELATPSPLPTAAEPDPAPASPEPPALEPEAPAASPITTARVAVDGDLRIWISGASGNLPPGEVPPGSYTIKAFFDPMEPIDAGRFEAKAGDDLIIRCSTAMARCTATPR